MTWIGLLSIAVALAQTGGGDNACPMAPPPARLLAQLEKHGLTPETPCSLDYSREATPAEIELKEDRQLEVPDADGKPVGFIRITFRDLSALLVFAVQDETNPHHREFVGLVYGYPLERDVGPVERSRRAAVFHRIIKAVNVGEVGDPDFLWRLVERLKRAIPPVDAS